MAIKLNRLSATKAEKLKAPGLYADGGGLYLQIKGAGIKSWIFRYRMGGRKTPRDMGLGPCHSVTLADARKKAGEQRGLIVEGIDPLEARNAVRAKGALDAARAISFEDCATRYIEAQKAGWRSDKHAGQWTATLTTYAYPTLGKLPVAAVDIGVVLKVLEPMWSEVPETAARVRGRIEAVLDWAKARGFREGENPARWRGNLDHLLPARSKVRRVQHHPALPYAEVGAFVHKLREEDGTAARALELLILTAARTAEVIGMTWEEVDLDAGVWTVPGERIKAGKEHRVPLSARAIAILKQQAKARQGLYVFAGGKKGKPLSNMAFLALLKRMGRDDITAHGFRSTFRDWGSERTNYPNEVLEMALAHTVDDKVEAAYRRGDLLEKRHRLMQDWAKYCGTATVPAKVIPIGKRKSAPAGRR